MIAVLICLLAVPMLAAEKPFTLATMPRVDVHAHIDNTWEVMDQYMELRRALKAQFDVDMAMWVSVGRREQAPPDFQQLRERYNGRILFVIHDYKIADGIRFSGQELVEWQERGAVGLKFYPGWQRGVEVDHPANDPTFHKMAQIGMIGASVHVADPSGTWGRRTEWFPEPVEFWRQQHAWENVLRRHPKVVFVNAHMLWLCYSDEQLDYLRYMLTTYPNLNVDLATAPEFLHPVGRENLREFMIEYADRIHFGTDMGTKWFTPDLGGAADKFATRTANYRRYFDLLETDKVMPSGLKGEFRIRGLALPQPVLEKIYFRNAMRIYPHVKANLKKLGYPVD